MLYLTGVGYIRNYVIANVVMDAIEQEEQELLRRGLYNKRLRPGFYVGTFFLLAFCISVGLSPVFNFIAEYVLGRTYFLTENPIFWIFIGVMFILGIWGETKQPFSPYQKQAKTTRLLRGLIMTVLLIIVAALVFTIIINI